MAQFLVADREASTVSALRRLLIDDGHDVHAFVEGRKALAALSTTRFDAILADLELRGANAVELTQAVRLHQPTACLFFMTVRAGLVSVAEACHVFGKPLPYQSFTQAVAACRGGRQHGCHLKAT